MPTNFQKFYNKNRLFLSVLTFSLFFVKVTPLDGMLVCSRANSSVFNWRLKDASEDNDVRDAGKLFHVCMSTQQQWGRCGRR